MSDNSTVDVKEWAAVADPPSTSEAQIIKAVLDSFGIPTMLSGETGLAAAYGLGGTGVPTLVPILVMVPAERLAEAQQVIHDARAAGKLQRDAADADTETEAEPAV